MRKKLIRGVAVVAACASASVGLVGLTTSTSLAGPPLGSNTLTPASGNTSTTFTLTPQSGSSCTGSGAAGYRWQTYMVESSVDASTLTYSGGPVGPAGAFVQPLYDSAGGNPVIDQNPSATPTGLISGIPTFSFSSVAGFLTNPGVYKIGFACTFGGAIEAGKYWETPITVSSVTASSFNYAFGAVPAAPTLNSPLTAGDGTLAGTFVPGTSVPAHTGFTVTAQPQPSGAPVTLPLGAAATSFTLTGLTNGTTYSVTVVGANSVGSSVASNAVTGTPAEAVRPPVTGLASTSQTGGFTLNWTAPTGTAPTGYTIAIVTDPGGTPVAGSPFSAGAAATSYSATGLAPGTYNCTVTPTHVAPATAQSASVTCIANAAQVIIQDITVERPVGALILTQRCGVNGPLASEPATPGFPTLAAVPASADQTGTAPTTGATPGGPADPEFPNYPYPAPASYPTHCGIDLGTATLVSTGSLAGQYYRTQGFINQVTVVDTRDTDTGWTVNGTMSDFVSVGDSFSGNYLGWTPSVTDDSDVTSAGYDQVVTAGATVLPNTAGGLSNGEPLASAASGAGLGIAVMDARLKLLIPIAANNGDYTGTLTFTVV